MSGFCNYVDVTWVDSPHSLFAFLRVKGPNVDLRLLAL